MSKVRAVMEAERRGPLDRVTWGDLQKIEQRAGEVLGAVVEHAPHAVQEVASATEEIRAILDGARAVWAELGQILRAVKGEEPAPEPARAPRRPRAPRKRGGKARGRTKGAAK